jgi:hypothetical protein
MSFLIPYITFKSIYNFYPQCFLNTLSFVRTYLAEIVPALATKIWRCLCALPPLCCPLPNRQRIPAAGSPQEVTVSAGPLGSSSSLPHPSSPHPQNPLAIHLGAPSLIEHQPKPKQSITWHKPLELKHPKT